MWSPRGIRDPVGVFAVAVVLVGAGATAGLAAVGVFPLPPAVRTGFTVVGAAIALGIYLATRREDGDAGELPAGVSVARAEHRWVKVILALGTSAAFTTLAVDDIDEVYFDEPDPQTTMSEREYAGIETTARFVDDHTTGPVSSDYVT